MSGDACIYCYCVCLLPIDRDSQTEQLCELQLPTAGAAAAAHRAIYIERQVGQVGKVSPLSRTKKLSEFSDSPAICLCVRDNFFICFYYFSAVLKKKMRIRLRTYPLVLKTGHTSLEYFCILLLLYICHHNATAAAAVSTM